MPEAEGDTDLVRTLNERLAIFECVLIAVSGRLELRDATDGKVIDTDVDLSRFVEAHPHLLTGD